MIDRTVRLVSLDIFITVLDGGDEEDSEERKDDETLRFPPKDNVSRCTARLRTPRRRVLTGEIVEKDGKN